MSNKLTLTSLIFLILATKASAQRPAQGFVITLKGDTIRGELFQSDREARKQTIHIKPAGQRATTYTAATLRGVGRRGQPLIESKMYGRANTPIFVETLVKGPVSLYKGYEATTQDSRYSPDIRYYLQLPDSSHLNVIEQSSLVLSLHRLLGDCLPGDFIQRTTAQRKNYSTNFLKQAVSEYYACRYSSQPVRIKSPYRGWYTSWGAKAGINNSRLEIASAFRYLGGLKSDNSMNWQAGVFGTLAYWNGFAVQAEVLFAQLRGNFSQAVNSGTTLYTIGRKANFTLQQLRVPVLLRYQAGHGLFRPFVLAGPYISYETSHAASIIEQRSDQVTATPREVIWPDPMAFGVQGGAGVYVSLPKSSGISVETTYNYGQQGHTKTDGFIYKGLGFGLALYR